MVVDLEVAMGDKDNQVPLRTQLLQVKVSTRFVHKKVWLIYFKTEKLHK